MPCQKTCTGNVFEDLGFENPDEKMVKAEPSIPIRRIVEQRGLKQKQVGELLGISQPEVSNIVRGAVDRFTIDRLFRFLTALGQNVQVIVSEAKNHKGQMTVMHSSV